MSDYRSMQIREEARQFALADDFLNEVVDYLIEECPMLQGIGGGEYPFDGWVNRLQNTLMDRMGWQPDSPAPRGRRDFKLSAAKRLRVFAKDNYRCVACGSSDDLTVDHILAWSKGGSNDEANLQTLCRSCNSRKGAR